MEPQIHTVKSVLVAAASNHFDEIFDQNLLSKKWILLRLLFEGGFYSRAASNTDDTVLEKILEWLDIMSLINARLTCKHWKLIIDNCDIMEKVLSKILKSNKWKDFAGSKYT